MKKISKVLLLSPLFLAMSSSLTSCGDSSSEKFTLKIINSEDYIYLDDEDPSNNMDQQFKKYVIQLARDGVIDKKYENVDVVYDTSDTNETLYSELQTGKSDYDLINVSDYMAQKMVSEGLVVPLYSEDQPREEAVPNYMKYASKEIRGRLDSIRAPLRDKDPETGEYLYAELKDYAVGYMWGTLGILFNPEYKEFQARGYSPEKVMFDMHHSFSAFWNTDYAKTISIKNSLRDTFAAGLMSTYEEDFSNILDTFEEAISEAAGDEEKIALAIEAYKKEFVKIFNGENESFSKVVSKVQKKLENLKDNIFGLEVDSGKQDIVTGKIGINLAWSGDAVYSMDQAEDPELVGEGNESTLYYCVPELGSNLWLDTWVMPKNDNRSEERRQLALMFLDFMSDPVNATQNMDYTGYTSFIGGEEIVDLIRDWYDVRASEIYEEVEGEYYGVYAIKGKHFYKVDYIDCVSSTHNKSLDGYKLLYYVPHLYDEEGELIEEPVDYKDLYNQYNVVYVKDEETGEPTSQHKKYGDIVLADKEYDEVDLSYFFNDTFGEDSEYQNNIDTVFYAEEYLAELVDVYNDDAEHENNSVGRQFFTQYPDEDTINRCAIMKDFGENNKLVMKMWEEFKSDPLPTSSFVIFMIIIGGGVGVLAYLLGTRYLVNRIRKKRKAKESK